jgi:hypothetical protein
MLLDALAVPAWNSQTPAEAVETLRRESLPEEADLLATLIADVEEEAAADRKEAERRTIPAWEPFPVAALPEPVRAYVAGHALALGLEPATVALPTLALLAAAIGNTREICPSPTWSEPPILWCVLVAESGSRKSPALAAALVPLREVQARAFGAHGAAMREYDRAVEEYDTARRRRASALVPPRPERPIATRYIVSDPTVEALAPILAENPPLAGPPTRRPVRSPRAGGLAGCRVPRARPG